MQDDNISLIVEDDVLHNFRYKSSIKKILKNDDDWDLLFIGEGIGREFIKNKVRKKSFRRKLYDVEHPATNCAEAYFIKKQAANTIYNNIIPFHLISDWELAYQISNLDLKVKWCLPSIFYQGSRSGKYKSELR